MTVALTILLLMLSTVSFLQGQTRIPNIHIEVEGIDLDAGTITGVGVSGVTVAGINRVFLYFDFSWQIMVGSCHDFIIILPQVELILPSQKKKKKIILSWL